MTKIMIAIFAILFLLNFGAITSDDLAPYELDEFIYNSFSNIGFNGSWVDDNTLMYPYNATFRFFYPENNTSELFIENSIFKGLGRVTFFVSPDKKFLLAKYNTKTVFRHSTVAQYVVLEVGNTENVYKLANDSFLSYATWDKNGNSLAYVLDNNIYYVSSPSEANNARTLTTDGVSGVIYNGVPDWVYEEEVLASGAAIWFSPSADKLVFGFFNDTKVQEFSYYLYGSTNDLYPEIVKLRYPKVGTTNPTVSLKYVDLRNSSSETITLDIIPTNIVSDDHILYDVTWATSDEVVAVVTNRVQNLAAISRCKVTNNNCYTETVYREANGWLELKAPIYNSDGTKNLMILAQPEGNDTYQHLVLTNVADNSSIRLTTGERVVLSIYGWDEKRNLIYYLGTTPESSAESHVFSIDISTLATNCLTCNFVTPEGNCTYATATFSKKYSHVAKTCTSGPSYAVVESTVDYNTSYLWTYNKLLREQLGQKLQPVKKYLKVKLESGFIANVLLFLPPKLNESDSLTSYPMIVYVYAGPGDFRVSNAFSNGFEKYVTTNRNYIYAYIDGRGTSRKGDKIRFQMYKKLATVEMEDQIAVTKSLRDQYSWIDKERIGIWGWSYGGFATSWVLVHDTEKVFNCYLAVAPVTNFLYYDSIYTERYMGLPTAEDNLSGYNNTSLMNRIESFKGKNYAILHGTADDNVHYQNTALLIKALEKADVQFLEQSYVDDAHSLTSYTPHVYHTIDRFFARSFGLNDPTYPDKRSHYNNNESRGFDETNHFMEKQLFTVEIRLAAYGLLQVISFSYRYLYALCDTYFPLKGYLQNKIQINN